MMESNDSENKKKASSSFQITSVTESHNLQGEVIEDSDDFEDSQNEDFSELLNSIGKADVQVTEQQFLETLDQVNKRVNQIFVTESIPSPIIPSTGGNYGIEIVSTCDKSVYENSNNANCSDDSVITVSVRSEATDLSEWQKRFKIVKIIRTEPYKRGRWECMDFMDQPTPQPESVKQEVPLSSNGSGISANNLGIAVAITSASQILSTAAVKSVSTYSHTQVGHTSHISHQFSVPSQSATSHGTNNLPIASANSHVITSLAPAVNAQSSALPNPVLSKVSVASVASGSQTSVQGTSAPQCSHLPTTVNISLPTVSTQASNLQYLKSSMTQSAAHLNPVSSTQVSTSTVPTSSTYGTPQTGIHSTSLPVNNMNKNSSPIVSTSTSVPVTMISTFLAPPVPPINTESYPNSNMLSSVCKTYGISSSVASQIGSGTSQPSALSCGPNITNNSGSGENIGGLVLSSRVSSPPSSAQHTSLNTSNLLDPSKSANQNPAVASSQQIFTTVPVQNSPMSTGHSFQVISNSLSQNITEDSDVNMKQITCSYSFHNHSQGEMTGDLSTAELSSGFLERSVDQPFEETESASCSSTVAIDNKIEQAMDLVKSHLMFAVREEVEVLKEKISELMERINQLEHENNFLRAHATQETLAQLVVSTGKLTQSQAGPQSAS